MTERHFTPEYLDAIRARVSLSDTVARRVRLAKHGRELVGLCPFHKEKTPSFTVSEDKGFYHCFGCGAHGDVIGFVMRTDNLEFRCAVERLAGDTGTTPARAPVPPPCRADDEQHRIECARELWRKAQPVAGTLAETYLQWRGITVEAPPTLRYLANAEYRPAGLRLPALIAAVACWPDRQISAIQRTFLCVDGRGKAGVANPRMTLGPVTGGAVRLAPASSRVALAEGLETALSILQSCPDLPAWAVLGTSGFSTVILPPSCREVLIAADGDEAGEIAAQKAAERFLGEGLKVRIARPPEGCGDFNDALTRGGNVVAFERPGKIVCHA